MLGLNIISRRGRTIRPKTLNQKRYVDAIDEHTIVFGIGPAGTGKTYLAMAKAVQSLQAKQVTRIILTRPAVEAGERLGFLPGTLSDKIDPYLRPLYDALHDMLDPESIPRLMAAGTIEVAPLAYMRGRTLNDAFIILDEAQNTTPEQMKMFLTRLGFGSKIVVTGDVTQVDLPGGQRSGLQVVREILGDVDDCQFSLLTSSDVVRHRLVGRIVDAYERWDARRSRGSELRPGSAPDRQQRRLGRQGPPRRISRRPSPQGDRSMTIEVANESGVGIDEIELVSVARYVLDRMRINPLAELSILLVDVDAMTELHVKWMDEPGPTDVMSFPMDELDTARRPDEAGPGPALLGDVVLCPAVAADAGRPGRPLARRRTAPADRARRACTCSVTTTPNPPRSGRCSGCRTSCWTPGAITARRWPGGPGWPRSTPPCWTRSGWPTRSWAEPDDRARADGAEPDVDSMDVLLLVVAAALVPIAGLLAAADAAITMVSPARVEEMARERRRGAAALHKHHRGPAAVHQPAAAAADRRGDHRHRDGGQGRAEHLGVPAVGRAWRWSPSWWWSPTWRSACCPGRSAASTPTRSGWRWPARPAAWPRCCRPSPRC